MDSVVHRISCFAACPHKEEGQDVTGEVKEALPVPGGLGLGIRDEGRGREVWWEDGAELIYVPQERKKGGFKNRLGHFLWSSSAGIICAAWSCALGTTWA